MTLNAFELYRDREAEYKRNQKLLRAPKVLVPIIFFIYAVMMMGFAGRATRAPKGPKIVKPKREIPEWKKKIFKANIYGKISYTRFTTNEVKIGIFDVNDWGRDEKLASVLLAQFIKIMGRKENKRSFANSVKIKLMASDPGVEEKKKLLKKTGFARDAGEGSTAVEIYCLDIT